MNDEFLKDALKIVDNLTYAQIQEGLREHGIEVKSIHSGKRLCDVPFEEIEVGMEVTGLMYQPGKVELVQVKEDMVAETKENWVHIRWEERYPSFGPHAKFRTVRVK